MELGATWNGFSLNESGDLAAAIEKTGQAIDTTYMTTTRLVSPWIHVSSENNAN
jgi:sorting nexin-41/42